MFIEMVSDWTMINYVLTLIVCVYGAGLFGWWGFKAGSPSAVFLYVMGIFISEGWAMGVAVYARSVHLYVNLAEYNEFITHSWFWFFRQLPTIIILLTLAVHMSIRAFHGRGRKDNHLRREED